MQSCTVYHLFENSVVVKDHLRTQLHVKLCQYNLWNYAIQVDNTSLLSEIMTNALAFFITQQRNVSIVEIVELKVETGNRSINKIKGCSAKISISSTHIRQIPPMDYIAFRNIT